MTKSEDFRRQAAICDEQAGLAVDPEDRAGFEKLARQWRMLAAEADAIEDRLAGGIVWHSDHDAHNSHRGSEPAREGRQEGRS